MSPDKDNEYFSDGITEDIIAQLSKISALKVISRTSAMSYKRTDKRLTAISFELGISYALEGSVRKAGNRLRIVAQLIDARTDEHLWAETYDRELDDVFAIQSEVAEKIAEALQARLTPGEKSRIAKRPTKNLEAYNLFLVGRHNHYRAVPEYFTKAITCFERAIELDPEFADAYAWLASTKYYNGAGYYGVRPHDVAPEVLSLLTKALDLDPMNAAAYQVRAEVRDWYNFEWEGAEADYRRALELNPNNSIAHIYYAFHLVACGRFEEALAERERAHELDPASWFIRGQGAFVQRLAQHFDEALTESRSLCELDPTNLGSWFLRGITATHLSLNDEALTSFCKSVQLADQLTFLHIMVAYGLAGVGNVREARAVLTKVFDREKREYIWPMGLALVYMRLGETDRALDYLEQSYADRVGWMLFIGFDSLFDPLRAHPRFQALIKKIGPPEAIARQQELIKRLPPELIYASSPKKSIVVLPFENMSPDKDNEYFSDGLTEEIIADLSNVNELSVISRGSAMTFKGTRKKTKEIAEDVNVRYVLEGSVRKEGNNIRITAQLIDGTTDVQLWSEKYSGTLDHVFEIQEKLSRSIVAALKVQLTTGENEKLTKRPIANLRAYECYLQAKKEYATNSKEGLDRALFLTREALQLEGDNELLFGTMASIYYGMWFSGFVDHDKNYERETKTCMESAFKLNPQSPQGYFAAGVLDYMQGKRHDAVRNFKLILKTDPSNSATMLILGTIYLDVGRAEAADPLLQRLLALDPLTAINQVMVGYLEWQQGRFQVALPYWKRAYVLENREFPQTYGAMRAHSPLQVKKMKHYK